MLLTVVVPVYNVQDHLGRCLLSLRDQDLDPGQYEIIVVNDGSTDDSLRIAQEHELADARIVVATQPNQGLSAARNAGTQMARGRFLYYVDGDDYVAARSLRPVVEMMDEHGLEVTRIKARKLQPHDVIEPSDPAGDGPKRLEIISGIDYMSRQDFPSEVWWYVFHREFLESTGVRFEVGRLMEDGIYTPSVLAAASRLAVTDHDVYRYVRHPGSTMRNPDPAHASKLVADFERVVFGLEELREQTVADGRATSGFLDRITLKQEMYVFFMLARLIRARIPAWPTIPEALSRLRAGGFYPLKEFPGDEYPGIRFRILTGVFNRPVLLYPFTYAVRAQLTARQWLSSRGA